MLIDVNQLPAKHNDLQNAHLLSGVFKYLYLIFAEDEVEVLKKDFSTLTIFNDFGHPFPLFWYHDNISFILRVSKQGSLNIFWSFS